MSSEAPTGWTVQLLGQAARIITGKTPSTKDDRFWNGEVPFVTPSDIGNSPWCDTVERHLSSLGASTVSTAPAGAVLFTCIASIGKSCILAEPSAFNQQINACIPGPSTDSYFLYSQLQEMGDGIRQLAGTTAVPIINKTTFSAIPISLPPLAEQRRIAEVLRSVDEAIAAAEELVSQRSRLKSDLTNELLSGTTRTRSVAADWPAMAFSEAVAINPKRQLPKAGDVPFLDMAGLPLNGALVQVVEKRPVASGGARFQTGDTLFARITPCAENGKLGFVSAVDGDSTAQGSTEFIVMGAREGLTSPEYVRWLSGWSFVRDHAIGLMEGTSGRQRIPVWAFNEIEVPVPSLPEQRQIAEVLSAIDETLEKERGEVTAMKRLKAALMSDLLSGHVRVPA